MAFTVSSNTATPGSKHLEKPMLEALALPLLRWGLLAATSIGCALDTRSPTRVDELPIETELTTPSQNDVGAPMRDGGARAPEEADSGQVDLVPAPTPNAAVMPMLSLMPRTPGELDPARTGFVLSGAGGNVSGEGDFNGDGRKDLIVTNRYATSLYIVFGTNPPAHRFVTEIPTAVDGVAFDMDDAPADGAETGWGGLFDSGVRFVGDVNRDGLDDVAIALGRAVPITETSLGNDAAVCIVFGDRVGGRISLDAILAGGGRGFAVRGPQITSMQAAGDVNGDGLADLVVGAPSRSNGGSAYVVFGKADSAPITLDAIDAGSGEGYAYGEPTLGERLGEHVTGVGDMNADGVPDLALTAARADNTGSTVYVVWGARSGTGRYAVRDSGFMVVLGGRGPSGALAAANDVNGDGINDVLVSRWSFNDPTSVSYVVFGRTSPGIVDGPALEAGAGGGFAVFGGAISAAHPTPAHMGLAAIGDLNGDGLEDLLIGDALAATSGAYVVFGRTAVSPLRGPALSQTEGFIIPGYAAEDETGMGVSGLGDVNGDGLSDYAVTTPLLNPGSSNPNEATHIVYGNTRFDTVQQ